MFLCVKCLQNQVESRLSIMFIRKMCEDQPINGMVAVKKCCKKVEKWRNVTAAKTKTENVIIPKSLEKYEKQAEEEWEQHNFELG